MAINEDCPARLRRCFHTSERRANRGQCSTAEGKDMQSHKTTGSKLGSVQGPRQQSGTGVLCWAWN